MFEADISGRTYKVVFQYAKDVDFVLPSNEDNDVVVKRDGVYAHLMKLDEENTTKDVKVWQSLFSGFAAAHPNQSRRSSKNCGRKVALARALDQTGFSKETRLQFWNAYFKSRGKVN